MWWARTPSPLRTRNHGNLTINATINVSGGDATQNPHLVGVGVAGGYDGSLANVNGQGPGGGKAKGVNNNGGGGAYGGRGYNDDSATSLTYGEADLAGHLLGGSGGGGGNWYPGGAGGGAVELFAHGDGVLTVGGTIKANGGDASSNNANSGGGGSGGAIRLEGGSVTISGSLEAKGGQGVTPTEGGGGRIAIKTNGNLTLGTIALNGYRPGTLHLSGATPTNSIDLSTGTITFDTTYGYWHHTSGVHGTGVFEDKNDDGMEYKTCTFTFDSINLASGLTVVLQGDNSLILKTRNHGNISVGTDLLADGGDSNTNYSAHYRSVWYGIGKVGGADGGKQNVGNGLGVGGGKLSVDGIVGGGGGYATAGQYHSTDVNYGKIYGANALSHLHGGSGGGAASATGGGAGGGAISLEADGNGTLTIQSGATLSANGGGVADAASNGGGGGSGGSIRLSGKTITNNGTIRAKGATPPAGGIGGGGRVAFNYSDNLVEGTVDVGTGFYQGSIAYNTPPSVSSGASATATFSNDNYRKNSAVRYDDLVVWYPFDEADGTTAYDFSANGRDATLMNMSAANRVGGKIGRALSFDTLSSKVAPDATGQYVDMGTWSFGGALTFSTWIKVDEFRDHYYIMHMAGSDAINIRAPQSTETTKLQFEFQNTLGGNEYYDSGESFMQWGQWVHIALTVVDEGANLSTARWYKNGSIYATSSANLTAPDSVSRSTQYLGRTQWTGKPYFAGDMDDFRLYRVALSDSEIGDLYSETNGTAWYTIAAINNPTSFSATGLPSGLSVNADTGEISGHTTAIGDHNVTVTASNLSGSDSKVITLTVGPTKPLLKTAYTVTRQSDLLGWLKFDEQTGFTSTNYGTEGSAATLMSGAAFSTTEKKFGKSSLNLPTNQQNARARITTPIDVGDNSASDPYSLAAWFKGLYDYTDNNQGWRTLTRGSGANHQVIVLDNGDTLGTHSGWVSSGYNLTPEASDTTWQHIVATFDGSTTKFYIDGSYVAQLNASKGNNIYHVGNHSGNQQLVRISR